MASHSRKRDTIRPLDGPPEPQSTPGSATEAPPLGPGIEQVREIVERGVELLYRQRRGFGLAAGFVGLTLALGILLQTSLYEATSLLLVKFGRELVYQPEVGAEQSITSRDKETVINSELAIMRSRPVLQAVVHNVGIGTLYPDLGEAFEEASEAGASGPTDPTLTMLYAEAAERLDASLAAQALPDADVLTVSFQHEDPIVAATTVRELVSRFLEAHLGAYSEPGVVTFLDQRVSEYQELLGASERLLLEFETAHAAFALESPQMTLMQWRDEARGELTGIENQIGVIRLRHLEDAAVAEARNTLMNLQMEQGQLKGDLRRDASERIQVVRRFIGTRRAEVERDVETLREKQTVLHARLKEIEQELTQLPSLAADYRGLRRERDADEEQYSTYSRRLRDARLSSEMDREKIASISVIQPASTATGPVWPPSKPLSLVVAMVLALGAGGLAVVLLERVGPTGFPWLDAEPGENA